MNLKVRSAFLVVTVVVIIAAWWRYGYLLPSEVPAKLAAKAQANESFDLRRITTFDWDRVIFLGPYSDQATAERALGTAWPEYFVFGLESSDSFSLIVFVNGRHIVKAEKISRCLPDFDPSVLARGLAPTETSFRFVPGNGCVTMVTRDNTAAYTAFEGTRWGRTSTWRTSWRRAPQLVR